MGLPLRHDHEHETEHGRASVSLSNLPAELLSKVFAHVFEDSYVWFEGYNHFYTQTDEHSPSSSSSSSCGDGDPPPAQAPFPSSLLALRLLNKSFLNNPLLQREFLRHSTVVISSGYDLDQLLNRVDAVHRGFIRKACIRAKWRSGRASLFKLNRGSRKKKLVLPEWQYLNIDTLTGALPNLRSLSVQQHGAHINTFNHDLAYPVEHLLRARELAATAAAAATTMTGVSVHDHDHFSTLTPTDSLRPYRTPASLKDDNNSTPWSDPAMTHTLSDFSRTLSHCIQRTASRFDCGKEWYYSLVADATARGVEMVFDLELMFLAEPDHHENFDAEIFDMFKDVRVSNRDWILRLRVGATEYEFPQLDPIRFRLGGEQQQHQQQQQQQHGEMEESNLVGEIEV